jgi:uncharacterized membrane protein
MKKASSLAKEHLRYIFTGIISWLPLGLLMVGIIYVISLLNSAGEGFLGLFFSEGVPAGLGILLCIVIFYITGLVIVKTALSRLISRIPFIGMFFGEGGNAMTLDKLSKLTPCMFLFSPTCPSYGWILWEHGVDISNKKADFDLVTVYYPNVPTILTGQVYSVRKDTVIILGNQSGEIVNILLYGIKRPEIIRFLPWEGESEEDFKRRAARFGLKSTESGGLPQSLKDKKQADIG